AREASRLEPAIVLRAGAKAAVRKPAWGSLFLIGLACLFVAALFARLSLNPGPDWLSFVACFFLLTGWSLMVPMISRLLSRALDRALSITRQAAHRPYAMLLKMSATQFERSLHRTSVTVAALMAAVAMLIGVTVMISSFRQTIETWMQRSLVADLFLSPASQLVLGVHDTLPPRLRTFLTDQPEVESVDSFRQVQVVMPDGDEIGLGVVDGPRRDNLSFKTGNASQILSFFYNNDAVMVSEPLAQRYGLRRGEEVLLPTPSGTQSFPIAGVFYDYTDDRGVLFMRRSTYRQFWDDPKEQSLAIYLKDGVNQSESGMSTILGERIRQAFGQEGAFLLLSNGEIREEVRRIFNQTFAVTSMLRSIAIIVALIGIILTLTTLVQERGREIGVLRSIGASRWQICQLFLGEASLIGLASSLIGMAAGIALAVILTTFVNLAFFGWTIPLNLPLGEILPTPVWVTIVACLAGLVPAYKAASLPLNKAVRME
ncbi:MAG: FtsX-like permease family protein, partial [Verrucomicrobiota bacterium]